MSRLIKPSQIITKSASPSPAPYRGEKVERIEIAKLSAQSSIPPARDTLIKETQFYKLDDEGNFIVLITDAFSAFERLSYLLNVAEKGSFMTKSPTSYGATMPRDQICYSPKKTGDYFYSGRKHRTEEMPYYVQCLMIAAVAKLREVPGCPIKEEELKLDLLTSLYYGPEHKNGGSIGAHKDDENSNWYAVIGCSFGQTRYLRIRSDLTKEFVSLEMSDNSIIAMIGPSFQKKYTHQIDKLKPKEQIYGRHSLNGRFF